MIPAVPWLTFVAVAAVVAASGVVLGIRKKEWPRAARAAAITIGAFAAVPVLFQVLVMALTATCYPTASCP